MLYKLLKFLEVPDVNTKRYLPAKDTNNEGKLDLKPMLSGSVSNYSSTAAWQTIMLIDVSGSMSRRDCKPNRLQAAKMAAKEFVIERLKHCRDDHVAVAFFCHYARTVIPFTKITQTESILNAIDSLKVNGSTDIKAGLETSVQIFSEYKHSSSRRIINLLTDGHGGHPLKIASKLKDADVLLEVIGVGGKPENVNEKILKKVATTDTDGYTHYRFIRDTETLIRHYSNLASGIVYKGK